MKTNNKNGYPFDRIPAFSARVVCLLFVNNLSNVLIQKKGLTYFVSDLRNEAFR